MMLDPPANMLFNFAIGCGVCITIGTILSSHAVWNQLFKKGEVELYLKRGEYGESERKSSRSWSPFEEPFNAWTSLAYSALGFIILITGIQDSMLPTTMVKNHLTEAWGFSILYGISTVYLGFASMLFHASHAETWRKADAGMTSGVVIAPLVFLLWDHLPPPAIPIVGMVIAAAILQVSLTHGYLPYGSSDILLPSLVAISYVIELLPRYGGVQDDQQYIMWAQGLYAVLVALLLRIADVKRKNDTTRKLLLALTGGLTVIAGCLLGWDNTCVWAGAAAWVIVLLHVHLGHVCWHIGSAYALFYWWYMLRRRPGDAPITEAAVTDIPAFAILFCFALKNAVRRIFFALPLPSEAHRDRCLFLLEHVVFAVWGYYVMVTLPELEEPGSSWLHHSIKCWVSPSYPSKAFYMYYLAKVGAHTEDLVMLATSWYLHRQRGGNGTNTEAASPHLDSKMILHHLVTAALCIFSWLSGYSRIGSIVMFLHDVSDIPLDFGRICTLLKADSLLYASMAICLPTWAYWRCVQGGECYINVR